METAQTKIASCGLQACNANSKRIYHWEFRENILKLCNNPRHLTFLEQYL